MVVNPRLQNSSLVDRDLMGSIQLQGFAASDAATRAASSAANTRFCSAVSTAVGGTGSPTS
jgi:hypothetical protein